MSSVSILENRKAPSFTQFGIFEAHKVAERLENLATLVKLNFAAQKIEERATQNVDTQTLLNLAQDELERAAIVSLELKETLSFFAKEAVAPLSMVTLSYLPQALESFYKASNALIATMAPILSQASSLYNQLGQILEGDLEAIDENSGEEDPFLLSLEQEHPSILRVYLECASLAAKNFQLFDYLEREKSETEASLILRRFSMEVADIAVKAQGGLIFLDTILRQGMKRPEDAVWNILVDEFLFNASLWRQKCQRFLWKYSKEGQGIARKLEKTQQLSRKKSPEDTPTQENQEDADEIRKANDVLYGEFAAYRDFVNRGGM